MEYIRTLQASLDNVTSLFLNIGFRAPICGQLAPEIKNWGFGASHEANNMHIAQSGGPCANA
jgi:hypothetical protein